MSARRDRRWLLRPTLLLGWLATAAWAQDEGPDPDFLEYLGSWEASDEDWTVFMDNAVASRTADPATEDEFDAGDDSKERDDEN